MEGSNKYCLLKIKTTITEGVSAKFSCKLPGSQRKKGTW